MKYRVVMTAEAQAAIWEHAQFIQSESGFSQRAADWVNECFAAIKTLELYPRRCGLAPENDRRDYEVRKLNFGNYLILFRVDDKIKVVYVTGFRHGMRDTPGAPAGEDL